jgi:sec-independent protein translocase protein TatA
VFGRIGPLEILLILLVLLLLVGARKIPEIARSLGRSFNQFKRGLRDTDLDTDDDARSGDDGEGDDA